MIVFHDHYHRHSALRLNPLATVGIIIGGAAALIIVALLVTAIYECTKQRHGKDTADTFVETCQCLTALATCCALASTPSY